MKINFLLIAFVALLTACSNTSEVETGSDRQATDKNTVHASTSEQVNKYANNPQAPETDTLNTIDQEFEDEDGKVILKALSNEEKNSTIGPVELTLNDIKVLDYTPALHLIDYFHGFTHNETNFNYVELTVSITNTSDQAVDFAPVSLLKTNEKEKKSFEDDFYLQNLYGVLSPQESKSGKLAFVIDHTEITDLTNITITTSDVFNQDKESLNKGQQFTFNLKSSD